MAGADYILDIRGAGGLAGAPRGGGDVESQAAAPEPQTPGAGRAWLAVHWRCCSAYSRVYRNKTATAYEGRCPRCGKLVTVRIGAEGTAARFFEAY
jgi:hypothetical protein